MEGESGVTRRIVDRLHSSDIQEDQMAGESGVTRSIIDELHSSDMINWKANVVLLEVSLMNFILRICKESKWKVNVVLLGVSLMKFILGIFKEIKWKLIAWCYSKDHR